MCQLLGMNANTPTDIQFSFEGFHLRGGLTDHHADGFGIAFFEDKGVRLFLDDKPSVDSAIAKLVRDYPIKSCAVISHIRKATQGRTTLANTHPFARELWGHYWVFAHNGDLQNFVGQNIYPANLPPLFAPVGNTDSEAAFCFILNTLRARFNEKPDFAALHKVILECTEQLRAYGIFNFLLSEGRYLFAHCSTSLFYIVRKAPFATAHLVDDDLTIDFAAHTTPNDCVAVIATVPLTDNETWIAFSPNELMAFENGAKMCV